jgi:glycerol-3-phosphate dehydrogenase
LNRTLSIKKLTTIPLWDFIIIGGGASGLGTALDAASRGYSVLLLEKSDFAKGTSSRSTKLIHGGVRYLAQGNIRLVHEALRERGILMRNAAHLVKQQRFVIPCYSHFQKIKYLAGLKLYDWMAQKNSLGKSLSLSKRQVGQQLPGIVLEGLVGGIEYYDAQFDDARLAINLAQTATESGAAVLNYFEVNALLKDRGKMCGVAVTDALNHKTYTLNAKVVINATGIFVDEILKLDCIKHHPLVRPSQGVHLVIDNTFLKTTEAILIPKTPDGRVLFIIPWYDKILLGTTDTPIDQIKPEPVALEAEIQFIIDTANNYLLKPVRRQDVLSVFAGLRPLAASKKKNTKEVSRSHKIIVSESGLVTIIGGKWTTYRKMAEDIVDKSIDVGGLKKLDCITPKIKIHGCGTENNTGSIYGSDEEKINELIKREPLLDKQLDDQFFYKDAHVVWSVREEMAMTVEDVLARRLRILFLNAQTAIDLAPRVAYLIAMELNYDEAWVQSQVKQFSELAQSYKIKSN